MAELYADVPGQPVAVGQLVAAARSPVHAYLLAGPAGSGKRAAARSFAAQLLCERGGCGECEDCRRVLSGVHPDFVVVERSGPFITVDEAREVARLSTRSPLQARRQVLVLCDFHLVDKAAPALLKSIEEPPATTVFVVLAERVPAELATIASRCVRIDFSPLPSASTGPEPDARRRAWESVPSRLDGTGAMVVIVAGELLELCEEAVEPVRASQRAEIEAAAAHAGQRGLPGRREMEERHRREQRRARTGELARGLAALQGAYRERLGASLAGGRGRASVPACVDAMDRIQASARALAQNPNETLLLQALLVRLSELAREVPAAGAG